MRISLYLKKEIRDDFAGLAKYYSKYYDVIRDIINAVRYLLKHGLKPEHIIVLAKLLNPPADNVEKELRAGLDDVIEKILRKLASIIDSFLTNVAVTSDYILARFFDQNTIDVIVKYKKNFEKTRKKEERKVDILSEIEKEFGE